MLDGERGIGKTYLLDTVIIPALERAGIKITKKEEIQTKEFIYFDYKREFKE